MTRDRERICPICKKPYSLPPAISRKDNKTPICPLCGMREAINAAYKFKKDFK